MPGNSRWDLIRRVKVKVAIVIAPMIGVRVGSNASPEEKVSKCLWFLVDKVYN